MIITAATIPPTDLAMMTGVNPVRNVYSGRPKNIADVVPVCVDTETHDVHRGGPNYNADSHHTSVESYLAEIAQYLK
ncbi:MAG: hypothetical protein KKF65_03880 [Nanoarchaeota archaeon]|nr:hypothetical protein [Nanoarchaeota archaeon]